MQTQNAGAPVILRDPPENPKPWDVYGYDPGLFWKMMVLGFEQYANNEPVNLVYRE